MDQSLLILSILLICSVVPSNIAKILNRRTFRNTRSIESSPIGNNLLETVPKSEMLLKKIFVKFSELGLNEVIAPSGFNFSYCSGECPRMIDVNRDNFMHAFVHSLLHLRFPNLIPEKYCEPKSYSGLMMVITKGDNLELVRLPKIKAKIC